MAWIESHQSLKDHPKTARIAKAMAWSLYETIGRLQCFWWWALTYAENGYLDRFSESEIAVAFGCPIDTAPALIRSLTEAGFLDVIKHEIVDDQNIACQNLVLRIHDWWQYSGHWLRSKYKRSPKKWHEIRNRYVTRTYRLRNRIPNLTKPNLTKPNPLLSPFSIIESLKSNPAFEGLDLQEQFYKMQAWCEVNNRKVTKRMFVNWLIRADKPFAANSHKEPEKLPGSWGVKTTKQQAEEQFMKDDEAAEALRKITAGLAKKMP